MRERGFTLIELLVAITISLMIFLGSSSLILVLFNSNVRVKQIDILQQTKNDLQIELSNAVRWGKTISFANIDTETNPRLTVDATTYKLDGGTIYKNDARLTSAEVTITGMEIHSYSVNSDYQSLQIIIAMENKHFAAIHDQLRLVVSQRPETVRINNNPPQILPPPPPPPPPHHGPPPPPPLPPPPPPPPKP